MKTRAVSSVGRAPALHAGCQGFESLTAHFIGSSRIGPSVIGIGSSGNRIIGDRHIDSSGNRIIGDRLIDSSVIGSSNGL
jgi:hypothetical protein